MSIITDLKNNYERGNISLRFIYINVGIFILTSVVNIGFTLFNRPFSLWLLQWFECPASLRRLLIQPWSLVTYMFMHADVFHILFNMLWLYWFGQLFLYLFSAKHFRGLYFLGGLCGGALYILAYNIFPFFAPYIGHSYMLGASASVLAIAVATAVREPDYRVNLLLFGAVRLKYLTLIMIVTDLLFITSSNAGGHTAHLGGAIAGFWFARSFQHGTDPTWWINKTIDTITGWFSRSKRPKKPKMKVHYGGRAADYDYNARKRDREAEIDRILEKLKKSGYESLTSEEKKSLFDASKK